MDKRCSKCGETKPLADFGLDSRNSSGRQSQCKKCQYAYDTERYRNNPDRRAKAQGRNRTGASRRWREDGPEKAKQYRTKLRADALAAYGAECSCCGEDWEPFLQIDHVEGNGNQHRKSIGKSQIYQWLRTNNYPPGFQVLCANCNFVKERGGCPPEHKSGGDLTSD